MRSADSYAKLASFLDGWLIKVILIGLSWAFFHHFYAGIRHLLQDVHWMTTLQKKHVFQVAWCCGWLVGISVFIFAVVIFL